MTQDDLACLNLGREVVRMIHEVRGVTAGSDGYAKRVISFPGGDVTILLCMGSVAETAEKAIARTFDVYDVESTEAKQQ